MVKGENIVDDALWAAVQARYPSTLIQAMTTSQNGSPPWLELLDDAGEPQAEAPAEPGPPRMNSRDSIVAIARCESVEGLERFRQGEDRKTVLAAIERRARSLGDALYITELNL